MRRGRSKMAWLRLEGMLYVVVGEVMNQGLGRIGYEI
jgi:hypothetical protein